jgi:hypothetical protein
MRYLNLVLGLVALGFAIWGPVDRWTAILGWSCVVLNDINMMITNKRKL